MLRPARIGVLATLARSSGGSFQWLVNIVDALDHFLAGQHASSVHVYYAPDYPDREELKRAFPALTFCELGLRDVTTTKVLRRTAFAIPRLIPLLRAAAPLNVLLRRHGIDWMIFPTVTLDSSFCTLPHSFFLADICHVFYPYFPEVSAGGEFRRREIMFQHGLRRANQVVVETEHLRADVARIYKIDQRKIQVLHQAFPVTLEQHAVWDTEMQEFSRELPQQFLFYPAQLWEHKNHANLLRALKLVHCEEPDTQLVLAGGRKPGDEAIFAQIHDLRLEDRVHYLGYVPDKLMPVLYQRAAALVMPTYFGPTNVPTLEAFGFGCPAIISELPGVREQTGDAALLFDPDSPEEMATAILRVLRDERLAAVLATRGRERLRLFSRERYRGSFSAILDSALKSVQALERAVG